MDIVKIQQYKSTFDDITKKVNDEDGNTIEIWYARELQEVLGYARWENLLVLLGVLLNHVKHWESILMTIFVRSRKWSH